MIGSGGSVHGGSLRAPGPFRGGPEHDPAVGNGATALGRRGGGGTACALVESVAWISERKDVLSTTFLFLALLAYDGYTRQPTGARNRIGRRVGPLRRSTGTWEDQLEVAPARIPHGAIMQLLNVAELR